MSAVRAGSSVARRFVLQQQEDYDLPGLDRWIAHDSRLDRLVNVDFITSTSPTAVVAAAGAARVLRDKRLARVLAAGHQRSDDSARSTKRIPYVVSERPTGVQVADLVGHVVFAPATAAAVVGEAAAALGAAAVAGEHHGWIRPQSLTVTNRGRVLVAGLGIDGALASQSGLSKSATEKADAVALAKVYLTAVTGLDADAVTVADLPDDLPPAALKLAKATIKGSGPKKLADITDALGTGDTGALRVMVAEAPSLWWPPPPVAPIPVEALLEQSATTDELALVPGSVVEGELLASADVAVTVPDDVVDAEVVDTDEIPLARPRTRFGGAVDDIDEFHDIVADQNREIRPTVAQTVTGILASRYPNNPTLARVAQAADKRAETQAPINAGPLLVGLGLTVVVVVGIVALTRFNEPFEPTFDLHNNPINTYPAYTHGPSPSPTPVSDG